VDKIRRFRQLALMGFAALAIVLAVNAPSQARGITGHGSGNGHSGGADMHHAFNEHHDFDRHHHFGFVPIYPPIYGYQVPAYWYYCPSYGTYYPNVTSCPEPWVPIPAS